MTSSQVIFNLIAFLISLLFYFIPTIMAFCRKHNNSTAIFVTDLFLGWTILGWIIALIWASTSIKKE